MIKAKIFQFSIVGLIIFQIAQSMELIMKHVAPFFQVITTKVHHRISIFPVIQMNENVFMLLSLLIIVLIIVFGALIFLDLKWIKTIIYVVAIYAIIAGALPLVFAVYFKQYFPGCYSAAGLIISGILVLITFSSFRRPEFQE